MVFGSTGSTATANSPSSSVSIAGRIGGVSVSSRIAGASAMSSSSSNVGGQIAQIGTVADPQDPQSDEQKQSLRRSPYTHHGVLQYLQHEFARYDMDRCRWDMERAELQARIAFLQGERRGQENLKNDLVRRIKMLEFALKQERAKNYRLTHDGAEPPTYDDDDGVAADENEAPGWDF